jgi:hypothetical protein
MSTIVNADCGQVLGVVDGRDSAAVGGWLHARSQVWRDRIEIGLFTVEGVVGWVARRSLGRGRGLPMMGVLTPPIGKTSTCLTLPSPALT